MPGPVRGSGDPPEPSVPLLHQQQELPTVEVWAARPTRLPTGQDVPAPTYMVARWHIFKPKNPILGTFWRDLDWKLLVPTYM
jgi:hypothetical protein